MDVSGRTQLHARLVAALDKLRAAYLALAEAEAVLALIAGILKIEIGTSTDDTSESEGCNANALPAPLAAADACYLSVRQLAQRIPYAEQTIRNLMAAGVLREGTHYFKRRGRVMFSWAAMRTWVEEEGEAAASLLPLAREERRGR